MSRDARFGLTLGAYAAVALVLCVAICCIRRRSRSQLRTVERKIKAAERKALSTAAYAGSPSAAASPGAIDRRDQELIDLKLRREYILDERWEDKFARVAVLFATVGYVQLTRMSVQSFQRGGEAPAPGSSDRSDAPAPRFRFAHDPSTAHYGTGHVCVMLVGALLVAGVTLGVPYFVFTWTQALRRDNMLEYTRTRRKFGALYDCYHRGKGKWDRYVISFGALTLLRRGVSVVTIVALHEFPRAQAATQIALTAAFAGVVWALQPFERARFTLFGCAFDNGFNRVEIAAALIHVVNQIYAVLLVEIGGMCGEEPLAIAGINDVNTTLAGCQNNDDACAERLFCSAATDTCCAPQPWMDTLALVIIFAVSLPFLLFLIFHVSAVVLHGCCNAGKTEDDEAVRKVQALWSLGRAALVAGQHHAARQMWRQARALGQEALHKITLRKHGRLAGSTAADASRELRAAMRVGVEAAFADADAADAAWRGVERGWRWRLRAGRARVAALVGDHKRAGAGSPAATPSPLSPVSPVHLSHKALVAELFAELGTLVRLRDEIVHSEWVFYAVDVAVEARKAILACYRERREALHRGVLVAKRRFDEECRQARRTVQKVRTHALLKNNLLWPSLRKACAKLGHVHREVSKATDADAGGTSDTGRSLRRRRRRRCCCLRLFAGILPPAPRAQAADNRASWLAQYPGDTSREAMLLGLLGERVDKTVAAMCAAAKLEHLTTLAAFREYERSRRQIDVDADTAEHQNLVNHPKIRRQRGKRRRKTFAFDDRDIMASQRRIDPSAAAVDSPSPTTSHPAMRRHSAGPVELRDFPNKKKGKKRGTNKRRKKRGSVRKRKKKRTKDPNKKKRKKRRKKGSKSKSKKPKDRPSSMLAVLAIETLRGRRGRSPLQVSMSAPRLSSPRSAKKWRKVKRKKKPPALLLDTPSPRDLEIILTPSPQPQRREKKKKKRAARPRGLSVALDASPVANAPDRPRLRSRLWRGETGTTGGGRASSSRRAVVQEEDIAQIKSTFAKEQQMRDASVRAIKARQKERAMRRRMSSTRLPPVTDEEQVDFFKAEHAADRAALKASLLQDRQRQRQKLAQRLAVRKLKSGGDGRRPSAFGFEGF